jgi:hypothetical protein
MSNGYFTEDDLRRGVKLLKSTIVEKGSSRLWQPGDALNTMGLAQIQLVRTSAAGAILSPTANSLVYHYEREYSFGANVNNVTPGLVKEHPKGGIPHRDRQLKINWGDAHYNIFTGVKGTGLSLAIDVVLETEWKIGPPKVPLAGAQVSRS